ncbi:MAG: acyltransferase, partial [Actinobacteria bacterium]|nr:acyltransferase [Actinomycetota bacterium]
MSGVSTDRSTATGRRGVPLERRSGRSISGPRRRVAWALVVGGTLVVVVALGLSVRSVRVGLRDGGTYRCGRAVARLTNPAPVKRWVTDSFPLVLQHRLDRQGPTLASRCGSAVDHRAMESVVGFGAGAALVGAGVLLLVRTRRGVGAKGGVVAAPRPPGALPSPTSTPARRVTLEFVPGLDGIRAVAVIAVMVFHAGVPHSKGGFLGVDTFFVLSGYLITSLLLTEWRRTETISLRAFWARRARRLLPALYLVVATVVISWAFFGDVSQRGALRLDALATLGYVANWRFIFGNASYFAPTQSAGLLRHMWSLAVEEQFYLVWPLVVLFVLRRWSLRVFAAVTAALAAVSVAVMVAVYRPTAVSRAYFGTDTRAHVLLIGALLALGLPRALSRARWRRAITAFGAIGAAFVVWSFTAIDGQGRFFYYGGSVLFACAAAAVVAVAVVGEGPVARALAWRPLRAVGRVSYGLYLWHWPVFLVVNHGRTGLSGVVLLTARVAVTAALTVASYELVERPVRRGELGRRALVLGPVSLVVVACIVLRATFPVATPAPDLAQLASYLNRRQSPSAKTALIIGDSVAFTLANGLPWNPDLDVEGHGLLGCGLMVGTVNSLGELKGAGCPDTIAVWRADVRRVRPSVVAVLVGRWEVRDHLVHGHWLHIGQPQFDRMLDARLDQLIDMITASGARVALLTAPFYDEGEQPNGNAWPEDDPAR